MEEWHWRWQPLPLRLSMASSAAPPSPPASEPASSLSSSTPSPLLLSSPFPVRLLLVRHGESLYNARPESVAGRSDDVPLTPLGRMQAEALASRLRAAAYWPHLLLSSTAIRASATASILFPDGGWLRSEELLEQSQGEWTGQPRSAVHSPAVLEVMQRLNVDFAAPGGESIRHTGERAIREIHRRVQLWMEGEEHREEGGVDGGVDMHVLVVAHGMLIRAILFHLVGLRGSCVWRVGCANCSLTELLIDVGGVSLVRVNDHAHLAAVKAHAQRS